jgi:hypothetical protein
MALLDQIEAVTNDFYEKNKVEDLYFKSNIMLYRLLGSGQSKLSLVTASETIDGGKKVLEFLEHAPVGGSTYGPTTTIPGTNHDIVNKASFDWSGYVGHDAIGLKERRENSGDAAMVMLVQKKLNSIAKTIRDTMGKGVYVARAASVDLQGFDGLPDLFDTTTTIAYGGIKEDDMPLWSPNIITTVEAMSYAVMSDIIATATTENSKESMPNLILGTKDLYNKYESSLQPLQRFVDKTTLAAGFENITHKGIPFVWDTQCPVGNVYAMNMGKIRIRSHEEFNFTQAKWVANDPATKPNDFIASTIWSGVLTTSDRSAHALHTSLTA